MTLKTLPYDLTVCKVASYEDFPADAPFYFTAKTQTELSLVCRAEDAPKDALAREDGWRAFYVDGTLDFSLVGVLSAISAALAARGIAIFAVSTFDTDYILVKREDFDAALAALSEDGYVLG